jgi:hypothetical protein
MLSELLARNAILGLTGLICLFGAIACVVLMQVDPRTVTGVSAWLKPLKFFVSTIFYLWTIGWLSGLLRDADTPVRFISGTLAAVMTAEMFLIVLQAARGVPSHFNFTTAFDGAVFSAMALLIVVGTAALVWFGALFFSSHSVHIPPAYLWGIRLGIIVTVVGSFQGFAMGSRLSHTVGAPDGVQGMPLTNWSVSHGDLRIAHALGLHALQFLPLIGFVISRWIGPNAVWLSLLAGICYTGMFLFLHVSALKGKPLF